MIRCRFVGEPGRQRALVKATVSVPSLRLEGDIDFLVDTGANATLLAPPDAAALGIDVTDLPEGEPAAGIGGESRTVFVEAIITLGELDYVLYLQILAPESESERREVEDMPSLLGTDILSGFAFFMEERTERAFLLEPDEADALPLPV